MCHAECSRMFDTSSSPSQESSTGCPYRTGNAPLHSLACWSNGSARTPLEAASVGFVLRDLAIPPPLRLRRRAAPAAVQCRMSRAADASNSEETNWRHYP